MYRHNDYEIPWQGYCFRFFVFTSLMALLGLHMYGYLTASSDNLEGDFSDIKYVVNQLTRGLSEVNQKHEHLKLEMDRISSALPRVQAATVRAHGSIQAYPASMQGFSRGPAGSALDYDQQVIDFALESAGARILDIGNTVPHVMYESSVGYALHALTSALCRGSHECINARAMLRPGTLPGECWAFKGEKGQATIRLLGMIHVTGMTLEHIPVQISPTKDISSAPRAIKLEGLSHRNDPNPHDFGTFEYNRDGRPLQYFEVENPSQKPFHIVRVQFQSNWGHPVYTCVYRVRIHGELAHEPQQSISQHCSSEEDAKVDVE